MSVKSKKMYSIQSFCIEFLDFCPFVEKEKGELRDVLDDKGYYNMWDYPLDEIDHIVENELNVVLVDTSYIDPKTFEIVEEYRWVEIPESEEDVSETEEDKQEYIKFLKDKVEEHCNSDGQLEMFWDYRDELDADTIIEAYRNYKKEGYSCVEDYIENVLYENNIDWIVQYENDFLKNVINDMEDSENEYIRKKASDNIDSIKDDLESAGYCGVSVNLKDLLRLTRIKVNVMFGTEKEQNYDMSSIVSSFGSWHEPYIDSVNEDILDNAVTYFIHQQGHTVEEVYCCLFDNPRGFKDVNKDEDNSFAKAIVNEMVNNSSEAMSELTALIELSGEDILTFFDMIENQENYLVFDKNTDMGIFNEWSGCGGLLEFQLDKPFVVPTSMVRDIQIEGAKNYNYSVDQVYGLIGSCWKDSLSYTNEKPELREENLNDMLARIRKECA